MCNCKETNGFKEKLAEAQRLTAETGEVHVVFAKQVVGHGKFSFMRKETDLTDELGICCYYLPDGTEKEFTPTNSIEVVDAEVVVSKPKKQSKNAKKNTEIIPEETAE